MDGLQEALARATHPGASPREVFQALDRLEPLVREEERRREARYSGLLGLVHRLIDAILRMLGLYRDPVDRSRRELRRVFHRPLPDPATSRDPLGHDRREDAQLINARITKFLLARGDRSTLRETIDYLLDFDLFTGSDRVAAYVAQDALRVDDPSVLDPIFAALDDPARAPAAARNLTLFNLPEPPVHQEITIPDLRAPLDLRFSSLREEIELVRDRSNGRVVVDADVWPEVERTERVIDRGVVTYPNWTLELILNGELIHFGLEYYVDEAGRSPAGAAQGTVTICTLRMAAARWREWWRRNRGRLALDPVSRRYVLR